MTATTQLDNRCRRLFLARLCALAAGGALTTNLSGKETRMAPIAMDLWQLIDALGKQIPFTKGKLEASLSLPLTDAGDRGNDQLQFFTGGPVSLQDGTTITAIDLRIRRRGPHPGFLVLAVGGACVTLAQVRAHFSALEITGVPRGRSLDETTQHTARLPWGDLTFGFAERAPDCLASIAFDPKQPSH